jgi:macrodomain Ter protein organizer (MatP/YcbG family)
MNDRLRVLQRQPRRISITLSYHVHEALLNRSEEEGRSVSNLCAFLLEDALREPSRSLNTTPMPINTMRTLGHSAANGNGHANGVPIMRQSPHH